MQNPILLAYQRVFRLFWAMIGSPSLAQSRFTGGCQVVIDQIHAAFGTGTSGAVKGALRKTAVGSVKKSLEHVGELVEDVRDLVGVGMVDLVHKGNQAEGWATNQWPTWKMVSRHSYFSRPTALNTSA